MSSALCLKGITKKFGNFIANNNVSLDVHKGTIHALVGENGAGKSTLSNIVYGMLQPTSGELLVNGKTVHFSSPHDAIQAGIGMVHQHFMLIPELSVTENIMLGYEGGSVLQKLPLKQAKERVLESAKECGFAVTPDALVAQLSVGEQQRVEILKLLFRQASMMIFDEPTAVLTPLETEQLFNTLRALRNKGNTIILITHKLDEVLAVADTVSVMRKGEIVGTKPTTAITKAELAQMMVGRSVLLRVPNPTPSPKETVLALNNVTYRTKQGAEKLTNLSFSIHAGEIYGIAGVEGNGQSELLHLLWGMADEGSFCSGNITINGNSLLGKKAAEIAEMGVSHTPENRLLHAVVPQYTITENLLFGRHREKAFHHGIGFKRTALQHYSNAMVTEYDIRCTAPQQQSLASLSGGNQQKVVLAREMNRPKLSLLLLAQPTRGVDIGAIETIHKKILEARDKGIAILLISSELEEIIALSTRIGCLYKGSIRHEFSLTEVEQGRQNEHEFAKTIGLQIT